MTKDIQIFAVLFVAVIAAVIIFVIKMQKRTEKAKQNLFEKIANSKNFTYYRKDILGLKTKISVLADFGRSRKPIEHIVAGEEDGNRVYLFNHGDIAQGSSSSGYTIPSWSVCLIEAKNNFGLNVMIFRGVIGFLGDMLIKHKPFSPHLVEVKVDDAGFKDYIVMAIDRDKCGIAINNGMLKIFSKHKKNFKLPMSFQANGNFLAVYTDQPNRSLHNTEQFENLLRFAKEMRTVLETI